MGSKQSRNQNENKDTRLNRNEGKSYWSSVSEKAVVFQKLSRAIDDMVDEIKGRWSAEINSDPKRQIKWFLYRDNFERSVRSGRSETRYVSMLMESRNLLFLEDNEDKPDFNENTVEKRLRKIIEFYDEKGYLRTVDQIMEECLKFAVISDRLYQDTIKTMGEYSAKAKTMVDKWLLSDTEGRKTGFIDSFISPHTVRYDPEYERTGEERVETMYIKYCSAVLGRSQHPNDAHFADDNASTVNEGFGKKDSAGLFIVGNIDMEQARARLYYQLWITTKWKDPSLSKSTPVEWNCRLCVTFPDMQNLLSENSEKVKAAFFRIQEALNHCRFKRLGPWSPSKRDMQEQKDRIVIYPARNQRID